MILTSYSDPYSNELCHTDNWIIIQGNEWLFDHQSCAITNDLNSNNILMLVYKSWPYVTTNDTSYILEIEYNFTITAASANNTIGSVGVIWFPDCNPYDYLAVSFKENEALASYATGIRKDYNYNNRYASNEGHSEFDLTKDRNHGALPFTLSLNTLYSMRIQIYSIVDSYINHNIYINNQHVLHDMKTYSTAFQRNTSWIGIKNTDVAVISHALTVHQPSNIDDGEAIIQWFQSFEATNISTMNPVTSLISTSSVSDISHTDLSYSNIINISHANGSLFPNIIAMVVIITVLLCCIMVMLVLWYNARKRQLFKREISSMIGTQNNIQNVHSVYSEGDHRVETPAGEESYAARLESESHSKSSNIMNNVEMMNEEDVAMIGMINDEFVIRSDGEIAQKPTKKGDYGTVDIVATAAVSQFKCQLSKINEGKHPTNVDLLS